jgi:hypothetical protein
MEFRGDCIGVKLEPRGHDDNHIMVRLLIEDDEHWRETNFSVSSYWIDDTLEVLNRVKKHMVQKQLPDMVEKRQCGWRFKRQW